MGQRKYYYLIGSTAITCPWHQFIQFIASHTGSWCTTARYSTVYSTVPLAYWNCCGARILWFFSVEALFVACLLVTTGLTSEKWATVGTPHTYIRIIHNLQGVRVAAYYLFSGTVQIIRHEIQAF